MSLLQFRHSFASLLSPNYCLPAIDCYFGLHFSAYFCCFRCNTCHYNHLHLLIIPKIPARSDHDTIMIWADIYDLLNHHASIQELRGKAALHQQIHVLVNALSSTPIIYIILNLFDYLWGHKNVPNLSQKGTLKPGKRIRHPGHQISLQSIPRWS